MLNQLIKSSSRWPKTTSAEASRDAKMAMIGRAITMPRTTQNITLRRFNARLGLFFATSDVKVIGRPIMLPNIAGICQCNLQECTDTNVRPGKLLQAESSRKCKGVGEESCHRLGADKGNSGEKAE